MADSNRFDGWCAVLARPITRRIAGAGAAIIWSTTAVAAPPTIGDCPIFPADHVWNARVDHLPVHPMSNQYAAAIGATAHVHADFGSGLWDGGPIGIPYVIVPADQPLVPVAFKYDDESDPGPYPIPPNPPIEGGPQSDGDRHILIIREGDCRLFELYAAYPQKDGTWYADSGAVFDLNDYELRPDGWTSADAAGLAILPGLVRYDEVASGVIDHALRFTAPQTQSEHVWPARHDASELTGPQYPPMGTRFRLRADFDVSPYPPEVRVILRALQTYGMMLADNGSRWYITGVPDERWDNDALHELHRVLGANFEAVDVSSLMLDSDSGQVACDLAPDINGDGQVDLGDLGIILSGFGCAGAACPGDVDGDGTVDLSDLGAVLGAFGQSCGSV